MNCGALSIFGIEKIFTWKEVFEELQPDRGESRTNTDGLFVFIINKQCCVDISIEIYSDSIHSNSLLKYRAVHGLTKND